MFKEDGVCTMLESINQWRDTPVWDKESIVEATKDWFMNLSESLERQADA